MTKEIKHQKWQQETLTNMLLESAGHREIDFSLKWKRVGWLRRLITKWLK